MPRHTEPSVNNALGSILQGMMALCRVRSENVRAIVDRPGLQPDILITAADRGPQVPRHLLHVARVRRAARQTRGGEDEGRGMGWRPFHALLSAVYDQIAARHERAGGDLNRDLLGFGRETYEAVRRLSAKWCAEPSVHRGKRRPRGAGLVV